MDESKAKRTGGNSTMKPALLLFGVSLTILTTHKMGVDLQHHTNDDKVRVISKALDTKRQTDDVKAFFYFYINQVELFAIVRE